MGKMNYENVENKDYGPSS